MGIQINGQTDTISAIDGSLNLTGAELPSVTNLNATGIVTASSFRGALTGNVTGNVNATGVSTFSGGIVVGTGASISSPATNVLTLGTNSAERVRINSSGAVGVGTANPQERLHSSITANNQNYLRLDNPSGTSYYGLNSSGDTEVNAATNNNLILKTYGTERLRIDSSGRVTMPYQPAFTAYLSTNYSYTGGGSRRAIPFDAVVTNIGSHFNTSTNRFIAPVAGMYLFTASLVCNSGSSTTYFSCDIFVNGGAVPGSSGWQNMGAGYQIQRSSLIVYLNVNDYVDVRMEKSANDTINGASNYSGFTGTLLG